MKETYKAQIVTLSNQFFFFRAHVTALPFGLNIVFSALSSNISE